MEACSADTILHWSTKFWCTEALSKAGNSVLNEVLMKLKQKPALSVNIKGLKYVKTVTESYNYSRRQEWLIGNQAYLKNHHHSV